MATRKSQIGKPHDNVKGGYATQGTRYSGPSKRTLRKRASKAKRSA
jgi:hypothetical protein